MGTFAERLQATRKSKQITQAKLGQMLGVQRSTVAKWEIGRREPDYATVGKLATMLGTSTDYLLGHTKDPTPPVQRTSPAMANLVQVPILASISAPDPAWPTSHIEGHLFAERDPDGQLFALRAPDEAMLPRILPGDLVIARRQHAVEDGEIAVVAWPEQEAAALRRVHHFDRHLVLAADNPRFRPAAFPAARVVIFGKVVEVRSAPAAALEPGFGAGAGQGTNNGS